MRTLKQVLAKMPWTAQIKEMLNDAVPTTVQETLQKALPANWGPHCQVVGWQNGQLFVIVDSAAYYTQFKFRTPQLLKQLRQEPTLKDLVAINCKVQRNLVKMTSNETMLTPARRPNPRSQKMLKLWSDLIERLRSSNIARP